MFRSKILDACERYCSVIWEEAIMKGRWERRTGKGIVSSWPKLQKKGLGNEIWKLLSLKLCVLVFLCIPRGKVKESYSKTIGFYLTDYQSQKHLEEHYLDKFVLIHFSIWGKIYANLIVVTKLSHHNLWDNISKSS